ncbi:MAG: DUF368 domain-containing protein [Tissierellia bacterium]|nr:DUF368 domain-containing protein [Tissierellia bacterium]
MKNLCIRFLKGFLIGVGAILPGISGGLLAVALGLYEPIIAFIANIKTRFKNGIGYFLPIIIGIGSGILVFAYITDKALEKYSQYFIAFFLALIYGSLKELLPEIKAKESKSNLVHTFIVAAIVFIFIELIKSKTKMIEINFINLFLSGGLLGLSFLIPGLSSSSFLIFFGIYKVLANAIYNFNFKILLPVILGGVFFVILSSKFIERLYQKRRVIVYKFIIGASAASFMAIFIDSYIAPLKSGIDFSLDTVLKLIICIIFFFIGIKLSERFNRKSI